MFVEGQNTRIDNSMAGNKEGVKSAMRNLEFIPDGEEVYSQSDASEHLEEEFNIIMDNAISKRLKS